MGINIDLSTLDGLLNYYTTPYVIWANDAAAETLDWDAAAEALDLPETISASFLGAAVLELTGRGEETPWFAFLNALRRVSPVVQKQTCVLADGSTVSRNHTARTIDLIRRDIGDDITFFMALENHGDFFQ